MSCSLKLPSDLCTAPGCNFQNQPRVPLKNAFFDVSQSFKVVQMHH